jgi:oligoendopeptidase F
LEKGGSESPAELLRPLGVDLQDRKFWEGGLSVLERTVAEFEEIWRGLRNQG